jgi:hypothetical protein
VCLIKGTNPIQCGYSDANCSCLVHCECAIACCVAVGLVYTVENGKNAMQPDHHPGFKKNYIPFKRKIFIMELVMRLIIVVIGTMEVISVMKMSKMVKKETMMTRILQLV